MTKKDDEKFRQNCQSSHDGECDKIQTVYLPKEFVKAGQKLMTQIMEKQNIRANGANR